MHLVAGGTKQRPWSGSVGVTQVWPTHGAASPGEEERSGRAGRRDEFRSLSLNKPEEGREFWGVGRTCENPRKV